MSQTLIGNHHSAKSRLKDSAATESRTDFNDSIFGDGDGSLAESNAVIGSHPAKSSSGLLLKEPVLGLTTDTNQIKSNAIRASKTGCSLYKRTPVADGKAHQKPDAYHAKKLVSARPDHGKHSPEECVQNDKKFIFAHDIGFQDTTDNSEAETTTEIVGKVTEEGLFTQEGLYPENPATGTDTSWQNEKGTRQWSKSTVLLLALFVGLRLCYDAWFGERSIFF